MSSARHSYKYKNMEGQCVETFTHQRAHTHMAIRMRMPMPTLRHIHMDTLVCVCVPVSAPAYMLVVYVRVGLITSVLFHKREVQAKC